MKTQKSFKYFNTVVAKHLPQTQKTNLNAAFQLIVAMYTSPYYLNLIKHL
jgi:hypothetical protein